MRTSAKMKSLPHTDYTPGPWRYKVCTIPNYRNGHYVDEWRIERTRAEGPLRATQAVCDVSGKRTEALKLARLLNSIMALTVQLATERNEKLRLLRVVLPQTLSKRQLDRLNRPTRGKSFSDSVLKEFGIAGRGKAGLHATK